jgi:putative hemolysin
MEHPEISKGPFQIHLPLHGSFARHFAPALERIAEHLLAFPGLNTVYNNIDKNDDFFEGALKTMKVSVDIHDEDLARIPAEGPVVVTANHPFGGLEGVILEALLRRVRPEAKLMANYMLEMIPEMRPVQFSVDPFGTEASTKKNIGALKETMRFVKNGGCLGIFPAGEVSSFDFDKMAVTDPEWSTTVGRLIRKTKADALPLYFQGSNSLAFQIFGLLHPRIRTALLPRELLNKQNRTISVRVGSLIPAKRIEEFEDDEQLTRYLRVRTYLLKDLPPGKNAEPFSLPRQKPVAKGKSQAEIEREYAELRKRALLVNSAEYEVVYGKGRDIPVMLHEIGRLREINFREVGEGSGEELDLDRFDEHYEHLILWHKEDKSIAGAYRLGRTDHIRDMYGTAGLYTATLFKFKKSFFEEINPAVELGRAFVDIKYRKNYSSLMLLWKGIAKYLCHHKRYKTLFGPVSISNAYSPLSRRLMMGFLEAHHRDMDHSFQHKVKPKTPPKVKMKSPGGVNFRDIGEVFRDVDDIAGAISEIETDGKGVPVLIRQYLKLGGVVLKFNLDRDFGDAIDGLMLVDLTKTPQSVLVRYMGKKEAQEFLDVHAKQ